MIVTLLAPAALALGAVAAGGLALLHAVTVGRPRPALLPTARFAPDRAPRAARRLARPADAWLLAVRVAAAALAALALARPVREPARRRIARVVLADVGAVATRGAVRDSVRALVSPGDALVPFADVPRAALHLVGRSPAASDDAAARRAAVDSALATAASDSDRAAGDLPAGSPASGTLSAALVAARRAVPAVVDAADSVELVIVSPFARDEVDAATLALRRSWAGRARLVRAARAPVAPAGAPMAASRPGRAPRVAVALRGGPTDDALAAALALAGTARDAAAPVRIVRDRATDADRTWATAPGHVLVVWPAVDAQTGPPRSDTAQALVVGAQVAVGAFGRVGHGGADASDIGAATGRSRTVARWSDGAPAAIEQRTGGGCVRTVAVRVPQTGDAALRPTFLATLPALLGPCDPPREPAALAPADLARLGGTGPLLAAASLRAPHSTDMPDPLGAALLATSAALLVAELPLRRLLRRPVDASNAEDDLGAGDRGTSSPDRSVASGPDGPNLAAVA